MHQNEARPLALGFIGFGTIAQRVASGIAGGEAGNACLTAVLTRRSDAEVAADVLATTDRDRFLAEPLDLVIELAGQDALRMHGEAVLQAGKDLMVLSIGALADDDLTARLTRAARSSRTRMLLPSGAIGGLDAISSAAMQGLEEVTLTTRKPPVALETGEPQDAALAGAHTEPVLLYEGPARDAVRLYPANVNVAAALSLAGLGFDRTFVRIYADPSVTRNTHEIVARGWFGEFRATIMNVPTENPKTGRITALSVLKAIRNLQEPVVLVG